MSVYIGFVQDYYHYLIVFFTLIIVCLCVNIISKNKKVNLEPLFIIFSGISFLYIGNRHINVGTDTMNYYTSFRFYELSNFFTIRKDPVFDYLQYIFAQYFDFQLFLIFCAFLYVFGMYYGLRKIFKKQFLLPFLLFLITPYFINWGVNVMRSGVAASLFIIALGTYYDNDKKWKVILWLVLSIMFHFSMIIPLFMFFLTKHIRNSKVLFLVWLGCILLALANINFLERIVNSIGFIAERGGSYATGEGEESSWGNFLVFGFGPVILAAYNIFIKQYKDNFYLWIFNSYLLLHIPYIILINTEHAQRIAYLAEFLMPILILYPIIIQPKWKFNYKELKVTLLIFCVFMIKAYKILII